MKLTPYLTKLLIKNINDRQECVRVASIRGIEFLLETLGCSLDNYMLSILRAIVYSYPSNQPATGAAGGALAAPFSVDSVNNSMISSTSDKHPPLSPRSGNSTTEFRKRGGLLSSPGRTGNAQGRRRGNEAVLASEPASNFQATVKTLYNHVLERFISVLSSISSHILHQIFYELIT